MTFLDHRLHQEQIRYRKMNAHLIDFASNDLLGLARSQKLIKACISEWHQILTLGATGSALLTGYSQLIEDVENQIALFHGYETGLIFNCGYMANMGLISAVTQLKDVIFFDRHIHASTHEGIRLSQAKALSFRHNDLDQLEEHLKNHQNFNHRFICVESIYSVDGSIAPLRELCQLAALYHAYLIVDEAHAIGAWGRYGKGLVNDLGLTKEVFAQIVTFGKALGIYGAIVLGSKKLKQTLINFARSYIYTTALPSYALSAIRASYSLFPALEQDRFHLQNLIQIFIEKNITTSQTHIQSIPIKGQEAAKQLAIHLNQAGFDVRPLTSPTVKRGHEVVRICLHAFKTTQEVSNLLESLKIYLEDYA